MLKKSQFIIKIFFTFIIIILVSGCAGKVIIPDYPPTENALFQLANAVTETETLSGLAQIELVTPGNYYPARAILFVKKPSYLRLELIPPIGPPDFFLAATPQIMKILLPSKAEFYQGSPTGSNLSRFLPGPLSIENIVTILTCSPHLTGKVNYQRYAEKHNLKIKMKNESGKMQNVWIGPDGRLKKLENFDENGKMLYRAEYSDYTKEGGFIAGKIVISKDKLTSIIIKYSDIKIEKIIDSSLFDLSAPPGFKKIILD